MPKHNLKKLAQVVSLSLVASISMASDNTLRMLTSTVGGKTAGEHNRFVEYLSGQLDLDVTLIKPAGSFDQVMMTTLASGEKYDLINITTKDLDYLTAQGALMDMTPMIKQSKRLSDTDVIPQAEWDLIDRGGKLYGVPNKFEGGTMPVVRADWLQEMEMNVPASLDDWYQFFTGAKANYNAYGLTVAGLYDIQGFMSAAGVKAGYVIDKEGKRSIPYATDAAAEMYDWFGKLYKEGLLDPAFASNSGSDMTRQFLSNQTATVGYWDMWVGLFNNLRKIDNPEDSFLAKGVAGVPDKDGNIILRRGDSSIWVIPANADNPENAIKFLEFWHSEPGYLLGTLGLEGEDYYVENGNYTLTERGRQNGMDHGAPRVANPNWEHPIGLYEGIEQAQSIIMKYATPEYKPAEWLHAEKIVERYAFQAMSGRISGQQAVQSMQRELRRRRLIDS